MFCVISDSLEIDTAQFERATGWVLTPAGACRGDVCVPLAERSLPHLAQRLGMALVEDKAAGLWALGPATGSRREPGGTAPELELPDLDGRMHRLSDQRGRKVLLLAWAPW